MGHDEVGPLSQWPPLNLDRWARNFRGMMMTPRFPRVVGGVADDGCYLRATRGRPDVVFDYRSMEDGLDELTTRYIFFHRGGS